MESDTNANDYDPSPDLDYLTPYYWRVDVIDPNPGGTPVTCEGDERNFTTGGKAWDPDPEHEDVSDSNVIDLNWTADAFATSFVVQFLPCRFHLHG